MSPRQRKEHRFGRGLLLKLVKREHQWLPATQSFLMSILPLWVYRVSSLLGTHTAYLVLLPILFWLQYPEPGQEWNKSLFAFGRGVVLILAGGVCWTSLVKDYWCLPRPRPEIVKQMSVSNYHVKEFGFPSTHSAHAIGVALYTYLWMSKNAPQASPAHPSVFIGLAVYATLVPASRLATGMHGYTDVIGGLVIGLVSCGVVCQTEDLLNDWLVRSTLFQVCLTMIVLLVSLGTLHPDPISHCPCYVDSVCFASVVVGIIIGGKLLLIQSESLVLVSANGWMSVMQRILVGVCVVIIWKYGLTFVFGKVMG